MTSRWASRTVRGVLCVARQRRNLASSASRSPASLPSADMLPILAWRHSPYTPLPTASSGLWNNLYLLPSGSLRPMAYQPDTRSTGGDAGTHRDSVPASRHNNSRTAGPPPPCANPEFRGSSPLHDDHSEIRLQPTLFLPEKFLPVHGFVPPLSVPLHVMQSRRGDFIAKIPHRIGSLGADISLPAFQHVHKTIHRHI